jgi:hypothetical protein
MTCTDYSAIDITSNHTISIWSYFDTLDPGEGTYLSNRGENRYAIIYEFVDDNVEFLTSGHTGDNPRTNTAMTISSANTWYHILYSYDGSTQEGWLNGSKLVNESKSFTLGTTNNDYAIGHSDMGGVGGTPRNVHHGDLAEHAVWNVDLSDGEKQALANGVSPSLLSPSALVLYAPIWGVATPGPNLVSGASQFTVANASLANRAPVGRYTTPAIHNYWSAVATVAVGGPKGPLGHPFHGPFGGPIGA